MPNEKLHCANVLQLSISETNMPNETSGTLNLMVQRPYIVHIFYPNNDDR
jgi:hypothetical protein